MPELPEVETVARSLRPRLVGRTIRRVSTSGLSLRSPVDEVGLRLACEGARALGVRRIGKYLLIDLSSDFVVLAHLGMSGRFAFAQNNDALAPHTHAVFTLDEGELRYVDPRRFGVLVARRAGEVMASAELALLGPDPLSDAFTVEHLAREAASSRGVALKSFLLDQRRVAGLGNIYVCEALHAARLSPRRRANTLGGERVVRLHHEIRAVLAAAVARRGTTLRDYADADGGLGGNQHHLAVYGRAGAPCPSCGAAIRQIVQAARSTWYCPRCQR